MVGSSIHCPTCSSIIEIPEPETSDNAEDFSSQETSDDLKMSEIADISDKGPTMQINIPDQPLPKPKQRIIKIRRKE